MSNVVVKKGDLFSAPKGTVIAHSCNAQGVWGSGIAKAFADRYPEARRVYTAHCKDLGAKVMGTCLLIDAGDHIIACLFTSENYAAKKDPPDKIIHNTRLAIQDMLRQLSPDNAVHMCKINSGLFAVPWEQTDAVLQEFAREFTVWEF